MSVRAMTWAFEDAPVAGSDKLVLLAMADRADSHGRNVFESTARLAYKASVSRATAKRSLDNLLAAGVIKLGDQRAADYLRADRRPTVYDLCMNLHRDDTAPPSVAECAATPPLHVPPDNDETPDDLRGKYHPPSPPPETDLRGVKLTPRDQRPPSQDAFTGGQISAHGGSLVTPDTRTKPTTYRTPNGVLPDEESSGADDPPLFNLDPPSPSPSRPEKSARKTRAATKPRDPMITAAQELTRVYYDAVGGFCNFAAVLGVVRKALAAGEPPESVSAALQRLGDANRPVTTDTLRIECRGMIPAGRESTAGRMFALARRLRADDDPPASRPIAALPGGAAT